ncbi:MAG: ABC transporter permease [Ruminiclostridium sp.]
MRIIIEEMKKIYNLKILMLLVVGTVVFYELFILFDIQNFPNGRPALDGYNISVALQQNYGNEMDEKEFVDFKSRYAANVAQANALIQKNQVFQKAGITTYEAMQSLETVNRELYCQLVKEFQNMNIDLYFTLEEQTRMIERYENPINSSEYEKMSNDRQARMNEIIAQGNTQSVLHSVVFDNYNSLISKFSVFIVLCIILMITPMLIRDKLHLVSNLQCATKYGRKLLTSQLIAAIIATVLVITIQVELFLWVYSYNHTEMFYGANISSCFNLPFWFDMTFEQYIGLSIGMIYMMGIGIVCITFVISKLCKTYISAIAVQIPVIFIMAALCNQVFGFSFYIHKVKYYELATVLFVSILGFCAALVIIRREQIIDI